MSNIRISRLAHQLLSRQAVHYDVATKERLVFRNRFQILDKYKGRSDVFGSFTEILKLGINPMSGYHTPNGIYAFPVDYIIDTIEDEGLSGIPLVSGQPYLHIFSVSGLDKVLRFDMNDTAKIDEFKTGVPVMFPYEDGLIKLPEVQKMGEKAYADLKNKVILGKKKGTKLSCDQGFVWKMTEHLANSYPRWTGLMRQLGIIGAIDYGGGLIHGYESTQAVFFNPSSIKVLEVIHTKAPKGRANTDYTPFSVWAENVEKHMPRSVSELKSDIREFMKKPNKLSQKDVFATLSWFQQHGQGQESKSWNSEIINGIISEINEKRKKSKTDPKVIDKITQILQRFIK